GRQATPLNLLQLLTPAVGPERPLGAAGRHGSFQGSSCRTQPSRRARRPSFPRFLEMAQVRRRLAFSHWHQQAICTEEIDFLADGDIGVVLGADEFTPNRPRI